MAALDAFESMLKVQVPRDLGQKLPVKDFDDFGTFRDQAEMLKPSLDRVNFAGIYLSSLRGLQYKAELKDLA
jgi:hypothetical protein